MSQDGRIFCIKKCFRNPISVKQFRSRSDAKFCTSRQRVKTPYKQVSNGRRCLDFGLIIRVEYRSCSIERKKIPCLEQKI